MPTKRTAAAPETGPVAEAAGVLDMLQKKHAAAIDRRDKLVASRRRIAFLAVGAENPEAQRQVAEINTELAGLAETVATVEAAVAEAERRLRIAEEQKRLGEDRAAAEETLRCLREFERAAEELDACLAASANAYRRFEDVHARLVGAGAVRHPALEQVRALGRRALLTALSPVALVLHLEPVMPRERTSFSAVVGKWAVAVRNAVDQKLNPTAEENVA